MTSGRGTAGDGVRSPILSARMRVTGWEFCVENGITATARAAA
ncbi:hypothetical protein ACH4U6_01160 [Streptomyces netropsis]